MASPATQKPVAGKATGQIANQKTEHANNTPPKWPRQARWRERNPQKVWAHVATKSALRRGLIAKQPCERCGAEKAETHHADYDRPLAVTWLCRACHKAEHAALKKAGDA